MDNILYQENALSGELLWDMREIIGWGNGTILQSNKAVENSLYSIVAFDGSDPVGIGRLLGDGAFIWYLQDIIVIPPYQGRGIGKAIVTKLLEYAEKESIPETLVTYVLLASKGKEPFYEKLGFQVRPNRDEGAGMIIKKKIPGK